MEPHVMEARLESLEKNHHALQQHVEDIHNQLTKRIDVTDAMLREIRMEQKDMRQDMKTDMKDLKDTLHRVEIDSLKSWPPAAVEAINEANRTKNALIGGIILLIIALSGVSISLWTHW